MADTVVWARRVCGGWQCETGEFEVESLWEIDEQLKTGDQGVCCMTSKWNCAQLAPCSITAGSGAVIVMVRSKEAECTYP